MELTPTAKVLLGFIRLGKRNGYEIKQLVDISTRFFWAASYGQIYPELRRLEEQGLIAAEGEPEGGRRTRSYRLTAAGEDALESWLRSREPLASVMRDEGLLKLFFSSSMPREERVELIRTIRAHHEEILATLHENERRVLEGGGPQMVVRAGLAMHGAMVAVCDELERELTAEPARR